MVLAENCLAAGRYREGWALFEARREIGDYPEHALPMPAPPWQGWEPLAGRRILLWHEQGLGDMIQMLRFVPIVAQRGARILLAVQPPLKPLAAALPDVVQAITTGESFEQIDYHAPLMSLPHLLGVRLATVPASVPYLRIPPDRLEAWRIRLGPKSGPRIGIVCSGEQRNTQDAWRSAPAREFAPLLARPDAEFHLLQNEVRPADLDYLAARPNVRIHADALTDLCEAGALASQMDGIVTVCTAMAHLAGALGLPTWVLLSARAHWLWLTDRTDSPWYPTVRLLRQQTAHDWGAVMTQAAALLSARFPRAPVR